MNIKGSKLYSDITKSIKKRKLKLELLDSLMDGFDEERYGEVIKILYKLAYKIHYPNLNLEALNCKEVWDWSNEDFESALGKNKPLANHCSPLDYSLWVLTVLNIRGGEKDRCSKEEALLALYLFRKVC